jgi:hypothetical protein
MVLEILSYSNMKKRLVYDRLLTEYCREACWYRIAMSFRELKNERFSPSFWWKIVYFDVHFLSI